MIDITLSGFVKLAFQPAERKEDIEVSEANNHFLVYVSTELVWLVIHC